MSDTAPPPGDHDWIAFTAPNGDTGFQCSHCKLTAIHLPVPHTVSHCPHRPHPVLTLDEFLRSVRHRNANA